MTLEDFQEWAQDHKLLVVLFIIFVLVFIIGSTFMISNNGKITGKTVKTYNLDSDSPSQDFSKIEDSTTEETNDISLREALSKCYKRAEECDEGIPVLKTEYRYVCWQLYYYTGDVDELMDFADGLC